MEGRGRINRYTSKDADVFTLNLHAGVTPMFVTVEGKRYSSCFYCLRVNQVEVTHVWYRPDRAEFEHYDGETKKHVLNGGLLLTRFSTIGVKDDPTTIDTDFESFQKWCQQYYGERLP